MPKGRTVYLWNLCSINSYVYNIIDRGNAKNVRVNATMSLKIQKVCLTWQVTLSKFLIFIEPNNKKAIASFSKFASYFISKSYSSLYSFIQFSSPTCQRRPLRDFFAYRSILLKCLWSEKKCVLKNSLTLKNFLNYKVWSLQFSHSSLSTWDVKVRVMCK